MSTSAPGAKRSTKCGRCWAAQNMGAQSVGAAGQYKVWEHKVWALLGSTKCGGTKSVGTKCGRRWAAKKRCRATHHRSSLQVCPRPRVCTQVEMPALGLLWSTFRCEEQMNTDVCLWATMDLNGGASISKERSYIKGAVHRWKHAFLTS